MVCMNYMPINGSDTSDWAPFIFAAGLFYFAGSFVMVHLSFFRFCVCLLGCLLLGIYRD